jgi:hypothetical protein
MSLSDSQLFIASKIREASMQADPLTAIETVVGKFFSKLLRDIAGEVLHLRLASTRIAIRVEGQDEFRTFANANQNGPPLVGYSNGKRCNSTELLLELTEFAGVNVG